MSSFGPPMGDCRALRSLRITMKMERLTQRALFTAAEIALALGRTKRGVLMILRSAGISRDGQTASEHSRGQIGDGWKIESLPIAWRSELASIARRFNHPSIAHLLQNPPSRWQPAVPLSEIAANHIERASLIRSALRRALAMRDDSDDRERVRVGLEDYRRQVGAVSDRHWRRLFKRTIQRDAGQERFDDVVLYLEENLTRKRPSAAPSTVTPSERRVYDACVRVVNVSRPTLAESRDVWAVVCEEIDTQIKTGVPEKRARRSMVRVISDTGVGLAKTPAALQEAVKRKFEQWLVGGRCADALNDQRPISSGNHSRPHLPETDRHKLLNRALHHSGHLAHAYRELRENGELSEAIMSRYIDNPASKSYVPSAIRENVAADIRRLQAIHHGPREHKLGGAYIQRDWSGIAAGDFYQADDVTPPVYYWKETPSGIELMRGQFLPMIDERTTYLLGFVLISERNYNSLAIRSLITNVCSEHGLPRRGFSFEQGIWKLSKILTGSRTAGQWDNHDRGLRALVDEIRHAKLPRGKVIERTIGQLQDLMEDWPGYCGRDERHDHFERFEKLKLDVQAGRVPANEAFLSESEIADQFSRICAEYNETRQEGRKIPGMSPREAWEGLQSEPRQNFDERCLYLLAHDRRKVTVGRNGITLQIGKKRFNYKDEQTGQRVGEAVLAWFNPAKPDLLACTDLKQRELFVVERSFEIPAVDASAEELAREQRLCAAHNGYATELYRIVRNTLPASAFRRNLVDAKTARLGIEMGAKTAAVTTKARESFGQPPVHSAEAEKRMEAIRALHADDLALDAIKRQP
jgi:hypothetical protein